MTRLEDAVCDEAKKLIRRHEEYASKLHDENVRRQRRSAAQLPGYRVLRPQHWKLARGFNPYWVYPRRSAVSHAIQDAIRKGAYQPRNPTATYVPKEDGSIRTVSVFQVADSAVSTLIFRGLTEKNRPRFSARSYAYRSDLTAHDALQFLQSEFTSKRRLFIAEYDFRKYFDNISHDHIWATLDEQGFLITDEERQVARAFLGAPLPAKPDEYVEFGGEPRATGVPQGTSISLFLANVAAAPLDRALEHLRVGFVRYADDTLLWSSEYGQLCEGVDALFEASTRMGVELNPTKSGGVSLLVDPDSGAEFVTKKTYVEFVGYKASLATLEMKDSTVERVKRHIERLLYENLLAEPLRGVQDAGMLRKVDRDYGVFVSQVRRYLYGDLSEAELRRMQRRGIPPRRFKGLMSFYPLIDDTPVLQELDGWLASQAWLAMRKRAKLLAAQGFPLPPPHGLGRDDLTRFGRRSHTTGGWYDLSLPSFRRIARVVQAAAKQHGPNRVGRMGDPYVLSRHPYSA